MRTAIVGSLVTVLILGGYGSAQADPKIEPRQKDTSVLLKVTKRNPATTKSSSKSGPRTKPIASNQWGGVPCVVLPDGTTRCFGQPGTAPPTTPAKLTPGAILEATRRIGLPSLKIRIQPGKATLVNLDTIFYANPQTFNRNITLLGYDIDLIANPVSYTWHPGDGNRFNTTKAGNPYPSKDVTYRYQQPAKHVSPSVDVTYAVRFRVDDGAWQNLSQTLTATGQQSNLQVKEATAVLTSN